VYLRADRSVAYGRVVEVTGIHRRSGLDRIGLITERVWPE
jgi:biopolymer transport protein ExbD